MTKYKQFMRTIGPATAPDGSIVSMADVDAELEQWSAQEYGLERVLALADLKVGSDFWPRVLYVLVKYEEEE